jgi:hypothetical protein
VAVDRTSTFRVPSRSHAGFQFELVGELFRESLGGKALNGQPLAAVIPILDRVRDGDTAPWWPLFLEIPVHHLESNSRFSRMTFHKP